MNDGFGHQAYRLPDCRYDKLVRGSQDDRFAVIQCYQAVWLWHRLMTYSLYHRGYGCLG